MRTTVGRLGLALLSLAVSLVAVEILVRVALPQPITVASPGLYQADPPRNYRLAPGFRGRLANGAEFDTEVSVNGHGLRGPEVREGDPATRVLVLGDSYTFGWAVEARESFPAVLAETLAAEVPDLEVLDAGVPGWGQPDSLAWHEARGLELAPDLVLATVFLGNDVLDATVKHRPGQISPETPEAGQAAGFGLWLYRRSHLWRLANRAGLPSMLGFPEPFMMTFLKDMVETYRVEPSPLTLEGREGSRAALARLRDRAAERGIPLVAVLIPDQLQSDARHWERAMGFLGKDPALYDRDATRNYFLAVVSELGIPTIDLVPPLRAAMEAPDAEGGWFYVHDPHWTAKTHRLAGETLARELTARGVLPLPAASPEPASGEAPRAGLGRKASCRLAPQSTVGNSQAP